MKPQRADQTARTWQISIQTPQASQTSASLQAPNTTQLPTGPAHAAQHGTRPGAAHSMLSARTGGFEADAKLAGQLLEECIHALKAEGTPDRATQDKLMDIAERAGAHAPARAIDPRTLERHKQRDSNSPLPAETRAWLLSVPPLQDTFCDLVQRLCVAKAHLAVDPLFARELAGSVLSATNLRGSMGASDIIRSGLGHIAMQIDISDGVAAQQALRDGE